MGVADGSCKEDTVAIATAAGAFGVTCPVKGGAAQTNYGAALAKGNTLYFLHAEANPSWDRSIMKS